jgi:hypothetical protein
MQKRQKYSLTNTSSVSKVLPVSKQFKKMSSKKPYEVEYRGVIIRCSTPEEAVEVARQLGGTPDNPHHVPWRVDEFTDFVGRIQLMQRRLLWVLIKANCQPVRDYDLAAQLGVVGNQALAGVLSGITKVAKAMDIEPSRVYYQRTEYNQGNPERKYYITPAFLRAAQDAGWPTDADVLDDDKDERR